MVVSVSAANAQPAQLSGVQISKFGSYLSLSGESATESATINNAQIDVESGSTLSLNHVLLGTGSKISGAGAELHVNDVTAALSDTSAAVTFSGTLSGVESLTRMGHTAGVITPTQNESVVYMTSSLLDSVRVEGSSLTLDLTNVTTLAGYDYVGIYFVDGQGMAQFDTGVTLQAIIGEDGVMVDGYYHTADDGATSMVYFDLRGTGQVSAPIMVSAMSVSMVSVTQAIPEPTTASLSLLALAALAARRRRR